MAVCDHFYVSVYSCDVTHCLVQVVVDFSVKDINVLSEKAYITYGSGIGQYVSI